ncbi:hypothetical protein ABDI75_005511 [Klebsiella pneumoniae]
MNRKQFIQSRGATCRNWTWSWSFINHDDQLVIFGAWDVERDQERAVIGVRLENGIYGHSRFCNTDFDDKLACLNLSGV